MSLPNFRPSNDVSNVSLRRTRSIDCYRSRRLIPGFNFPRGDWVSGQGLSISFRDGTDRRWRTCTCVWCQTQDTSLSSDDSRDGSSLSRSFTAPLNNGTRARVRPRVLPLRRRFRRTHFSTLQEYKRILRHRARGESYFRCVRSVEAWTFLKLFRTSGINVLDELSREMKRIFSVPTHFASSLHANAAVDTIRRWIAFGI